VLNFYCTAKTWSTRVWKNCQTHLYDVADISAGVRVLTLVDQGEGHTVAERPEQQGIVLAFADTHKNGQVPATGWKLRH